MLFKNMNPDQLRDAYWSTRRALYGTSELARSVRQPRGRKMLARDTGRQLRDLDIIAAVARKQGIDLLAVSDTEVS